MRALELITGHVIFKLRYNQINQLKTTPETSPLVTGFILSLLLFLVWLCIDKTYGETNGQSTNHSLLYAFKQPVSMKFRIRSIEEMRLILPHKVCS